VSLPLQRAWQRRCPEKVGGYDVDAHFVPQRTQADLLATRAAYQTGRLTNGGGGLKDVPIIDYRAYADDQPNGDIHQRYHSFSMRERLIKANGDADNQVMLHEDFRYGYYSSASPLLLRALAEMDKWIAAIQADTASGTTHARIVRNKPATLQEGCMTRCQPDLHCREAADRERPVCDPVPGQAGAAHRRRRVDRRRRDQVPAEARDHGRLPGHVLGAAAGAPRADLPERRLRLGPSPASSSRDCAAPG